jgi:hypothetical protein
MTRFFYICSQFRNLAHYFTTMHGNGGKKLLTNRNSYAFKKQN